MITEVALKKECVQCGNIFCKTPKHSFKKWASQKFCSKSCGIKYNHSGPVFTDEEKRRKRQYYDRNRVASGYYRKKNLKWWLLAIKSLGGKCQMCGFKDIRALQIDHVNNDGAFERKTPTSTIKRYKTVISDMEKRYQLLCANCNWIKRAEYHESLFGKIDAPAKDK